MKQKLSRRAFLSSTAAAGIAGSLLMKSHGQGAAGPAGRGAALPKSIVSLIKGEERRKNAYEALVAIEDQILPELKRKKYVVLKPNLVSTINQLAATHADALRGVLDFLAPRFSGPVVIAESSAGRTLDGYNNFGFVKLVDEYRPREVSLIDLNEEGKYETFAILNADLHPVTVRLAARLLDPDAYVISCGAMKTHNVVVATLSIKNLTVGAPLRSGSKETPRWNDKRHYHGGVRQTHYDIFLTAQKMKPFWGAALIDGFEGMEGNGPASGQPVASRVAIASTDFVAADRVGVEVMGINPEWLGYLNYCATYGVGQGDLASIDVRGESPANVVKKYQLHGDIERQLQWMGPMTELPPRLG
jgi:uncharacterized protein (DUF362 family)